jgi:outer membrane protein
MKVRFGNGKRMLLACTGVALVGGGCGWLRASSVLDPYAAAPPAATAPWQPPGPATHYQPAADAWRPTPAVVPDPDTVYDLPRLIDVAQRANPDTREAWERARLLAAQLGRAEGAYLPQLTGGLQAGYTQDAIDAKGGTQLVRGSIVEPALALTWTLLDFGRRSAEVDLAQQTLLEANFTFNRTLQEVVYAVERNFYLLDASRAKVTAARATLETAQTVEEAATARKSVGLATQPEVLLARQESARAELDLERARGDVMDAQAALAQSIGIPPNVPLQITDLSAQPLPTTLPAAVEGVMDAALKNRPDLAARLAAVRAREAEERRARAEFFPTLWGTAGAAQAVRHYRAGPPFSSFDENNTLYGGLLNFEWPIFEGFERDNAVRSAQSGLNAAQAALAAVQLQALRDVWQAYADVKTAERKCEFALALLAASQDAYDSNLEAYRHGLSTVVDLLTAQRDLARARTTVIDSKAELLTASATLAFAAGEVPVESR